MHAMIRCLLAGATLCALLPVAPALSQPPATRSRPVEFENPSLPAKQKELLARYAETVGRWALVQRISNAVAAQNARELSLERIQDIDRAWQAGGNPDQLATELARNECAQALQALLAGNPGYAEAFVTDKRGALVCMS